MTILIIVGIIVLLGIIFASMYNSLVKLRNNRENAFADIGRVGRTAAPLA